MEASAKTIRKILDSGDQFLIPFFQRNYSWTRKHWERLRLDIWALLEDGGNNQHFLGPLVCTLWRANPGEVPAYQLIDGQQRLTTLSVLMAALRDACDDLGFKKLSAKIHEDYLIHRHEEDLQRYKIVPRTGDREVLIAVIERQIESSHKRFGIYRAWRFFRKHIGNYASQTSHDTERELNALFSVVADRLSLVVITISGENPYEIFESLNSTGLPLEESDLIRNFIFMQVPLAGQEGFSTARWGKFESLFDEGDSEPAIPATPFYRNYVMREGTYSKAKATFVDFKAQNRQRNLSPEEQVEELRRFAGYELQLRRPVTCADAELRNRLIELSQLDIMTASPLLLTLMDRHANALMSKDELLGCIHDLASFVLRRSVCAESTRAYGRWFCEAIRQIQDSPRQDLQGYWFHRGWPDDEAFIARLQDVPIYRRESKKARLILMALEDSYSHKEHVDPVTLTIEHVMPQTIGNTNAGKAWQAMLGDDWFVIHQKHLHTLGNLTLTGYNRELGNRSFPDKRDELARSKMLLNRPIAQLEAWDEDAMIHRGERLAHEVAKLWSRPAGGPGYALPTTGVDTPAGLSKRKKFQLDYWSALVDALQDRNGVVKPKAIEARTSLVFPVGSDHAHLWTWFVRRRQEISVGLALQRKRGRAIYKELLEAKNDIEREIGEELHWKQGSTCYVSVAEQGHVLRDELEWPEQHDWMIDRLERFYRVLGPRVKQLEAQFA